MSGSDSQSLEMSSDKNLVPKCVSKNSHSFDDRVCDDLTEVLLQFLPSEGKLRLECVSKQFQRTVFQKQCEITLVSSFKLRFLNNELVYENTIEDKVSDKHCLKSIESLLKKCPNIQSITLDIEYRFMKSIFLLITKYCDYLQELSFYMDDFREPEINEEFYRKFGSKLNYLGFREYRGRKIDYNLFPNLYSIGKKFDPETISPVRALRLNLKNLKELNIDISEQNQHLFPEVFHKFHKIRHLVLTENPRNSNATMNTVFNAFHNSPVLQNLNQLNFFTENREIGKQFLESLKQLPKKLPKLKSIKIGYFFVENFSRQLSPLKGFSELKRLELWITTKGEEDHDKFSFKAFGKLMKITHLKVGSHFEEKPVNWKILTDIDIYLPKLQYLCLDPIIITDEEGVKQMAESLSRLSSLQTIDLILKYEHISELMKAKIAEKCRKIRKIFIY